MTADQNTIMELRARIQELQNEVNCMNDSRDFRDAESVRSGPSHVPSQPPLLPLFRDLGWMRSRPGGMLSRNDKPLDIWNIALRNDDIQEFDAKWDEIVLSMTQIPSDDILESLYKLRIRESENLRTVLELYNMEIHQKKAGLDYHRLKTMVKRSIEQNLRTKNFETRNGNFETSAVVKNQRVKQREERSLGDCWQWWQCSKGDNCSFRHGKDKRAKSTQPNPSPGSSTQQRGKMHREPEVLEAEAQVEKWLDCCARITSKELAPLHSANKWHPPECLFCKSESGCRFGKSALTHTARFTNSLAKGLKKW